MLPFFDAGYKLSFVVYKNGTTNKSEIASFSFMADESKESFRFSFSSFDYLMSHNPAVIIIDKVISLNYLLFSIFMIFYLIGFCRMACASRTVPPQPHFALSLPCLKMDQENYCDSS